MSEVTGGETVSVNYTSGVPDTPKTNDEFKIEDDVNEILFYVAIDYDTDGSTAPTAPASYPAQDRMLGLIDQIRLLDAGKEFFSMEGRNLRMLSSLLYEDDEYFIEILQIVTSVSGDVKRANLPIPVRVPGSIGEIQYEVKLESDDSGLSANDKYVVNSVDFGFIPQYGGYNERFQIVHFDKTISGLNDINVNKELGQLNYLILNGYNTTPNLSDIIVKDKKVDVFRADYYEAIGKFRQYTHGVVDSATYPNVIILKFDEMLDVDDSTILKIKTSTSQAFNVTEIFVNEINAEVGSIPTHSAVRPGTNTIPSGVAGKTKLGTSVPSTTTRKSLDNVTVRPGLGVGIPTSGKVKKSRFLAGIRF